MAKHGASCTLCMLAAFCAVRLKYGQLRPVKSQETLALCHLNLLSWTFPSTRVGVFIHPHTIKLTFMSHLAVIYGFQFPWC